MSDGFHAVACEDEGCLHVEKVESRQEAIEKSANGCVKCYGYANAYWFEPMIRSAQVL